MTAIRGRPPDDEAAPRKRPPRTAVVPTAAASVGQADDSNGQGGMSAGHVLGPLPELPSEQHRRLLQLLHSTARPGAGGLPVSAWWQRDLAKRLQVSERTLKRLVADLREPAPPDPRSPTSTKASGLRLGLLKAERTKYRDQRTGQHRRGHNIYTLLVAAEVVAALPVRGVLRATPKQAVSSEDDATVAPRKPEVTPSLEESRVSNSGVSSTACALPDRRTCQHGKKIRPPVALRILGPSEARRIIAAAASWGDVSDVEALDLACRRAA